MLDRMIRGLASDRLASAATALEKRLPAAYQPLADSKRALLRLMMRPSQIKLARLKRDQKPVFLALRSRFSSNYDRLKQYEADQYVVPLWGDYNEELARAFLPYPRFSFLRYPTIRRTMFMTAGGKWLTDELAYIERRIPKNRLRALLQEDYAGDPLLQSSAYLTSHNSVHHLYHLVRFIETTRCNLDEVSTVVEWGGGYGNFSKIFKRLSPAPSTYIIIDTPLFSCIQWLYLSTVLGEGCVNLLTHPSDDILVGKVNLMPIGLLDKHSVKADLFISTWALSESSEYSQEYVVTRDWFAAKHVLLAYCGNSLPGAKRLSVEEIQPLPGHYYAFR